jgi:membrane protease YdiL (CAAX protease family)
MTPGPLDHLGALVLVVLWPLHARWAYGRAVQELRGGRAGVRLREYRMTMVIEWLLAAAFMTAWFGSGRTAGALGLALPDGTPTWLGLGVTLLALAFLGYQERTLRRMDACELTRHLTSQVEPVDAILPRTAAEVRAFRALCVTAGVCEELLYRGFLLAHAAAYLGAWPGALAAGAAFGLAHAYQGATGVLKTGAVGLLAGALAVLSGSILWPMILHVAIDLQGAAIAQRFLAARREGTAPAGA